MSTYSFSVGKVKIKEGASLVKEVTPIKDIDFSYSISTIKKIGPTGAPIDEFEQEESLSVSFSYAANSYELASIKDKEVDLYFESGDLGNGIVVTIATCTLSSYTLRQTSSTHAIATLVFSKKGEIGSGPGDTITKQKVSFGDTGSWVQIGDSAAINTAYSGNAQVLIIPTALGVLLRPTKTMGGGQLTITVNAYVSKNTRLELEQYLINLYGLLSTEKKKLKVEYGLTSYTIDDVVWMSGRPEANQTNFTDFSLEFVKSGY